MIPSSGGFNSSSAKLDHENRGLDFFQIRSWVVVGTCFEAMHKVIGVDLAAPAKLGDVFEQRICLLNAGKLFLKLSRVAGHQFEDRPTPAMTAVDDNRRLPTRGRTERQW